MIYYEITTCPYCDDSRIETVGHPEFVGDEEIVFEVYCAGCSKSYLEVYRLHHRESRDGAFLDGRED